MEKRKITRKIVKEAKDDKKVCCICGKEFVGYGNNPNPVKCDGVCCDTCNTDVVIPARLGEINESKEGCCKVDDRILSIKHEDINIEDGLEKGKEILKSIKESKKLQERHWKYELKSGVDLRNAIDDGDIPKVKEALKKCYKELLDKEFIDEYDYEDWAEEVDDCIEEEDEIDYLLDKLYDFCDDMGVFVALYESYKTKARKHCKGKECKKSIKEAPEYELRPRYDSSNSFYGKAVVDTGRDNDKNKLYSYGTLVAEIKDGKPVVYGTYSSTTLRHIKDWLKQNGFKADSLKQIQTDYMDESIKESKKFKLEESRKLNEIMINKLQDFIERTKKDFPELVSETQKELDGSKTKGEDFAILSVFFSKLLDKAVDKWGWVDAGVLFDDDESMSPMPESVLKQFASSCFNIKNLEPLYDLGIWDGFEDIQDFIDEPSEEDYAKFKEETKEYAEEVFEDSINESKEDKKEEDKKEPEIDKKEEDDKKDKEDKKQALKPNLKREKGNKKDKDEEEVEVEKDITLDMLNDDDFDFEIDNVEEGNRFVGNAIRNLISNEWDAIDIVKTYIVDPEIRVNDDVVSILNQIVDNKTIEIGMLNKALQVVGDDEDYDLMAQGEEKASEIIDKEEEPKFEKELKIKDTKKIDDIDLDNLDIDDIDTDFSFDINFDEEGKNEKDDDAMFVRFDDLELD